MSRAIICDRCGEVHKIHSLVSIKPRGWKEIDIEDVSTTQNLCSSCSTFFKAFMLNKKMVGEK